tara:strand:+ start:2110 stop:2541 length:432 start_codon:yes stop_codon:yes gene_type:complete
MSKVDNKFHLSWGDIEVLVEKLCDKITSSKLEVKDLWGLPRGGLIPTVMVSHRLSIPITKGTISPTTLIIDDICDSGLTFEKYYDIHQNYHSFPFNLKTACLHYKPHTSSFKPTLWANHWSSNDWIIYPWEKEDSKTIQDYKV